MGIKKLLGLEKEDVTDSEIVEAINKAKKEGKDSVVIKGVEIKFKKHEFSECGILD